MLKFTWLFTGVSHLSSLSTENIRTHLSHTHPHHLRSNCSVLFSLTLSSLTVRAANLVLTSVFCLLVFDICLSFDILSADLSNFGLVSTIVLYLPLGFVHLSIQYQVKNWTTTACVLVHFLYNPWQCDNNIQLQKLLSTCSWFSGMRNDSI